jgi:hypothetical protein
MGSSENIPDIVGVYTNLMYLNIIDTCVHRYCFIWLKLVPIMTYMDDLHITLYQLHIRRTCRTHTQLFGITYKYNLHIFLVSTTFSRSLMNETCGFPYSQQINLRRKANNIVHIHKIFTCPSTQVYSEQYT